MEQPKPSSRPLIGVPSFLIFLVFGLSGISIALFSFTFEYTIEDLMDERTLPWITTLLLRMPIGLWIGLFFLIGFVIAWWFQSLENRLGEVPRRAAGLVAILGLMVTLFILVGMALPFLQGMGAASGHAG
ncbi:MAG: hypothetical protein KDM63_20715 [Verrucomicrobiae bacterium]|nr:hypothetical protein [Verrucomicrobiae bacterium]MCB1089474.1 hypothetical protein [Verrucomicrobiae bacterium]MCB1091211.1 hypothetical protein [Verrucomicrobiae bacterium]